MAAVVKEVGQDLTARLKASVAKAKDKPKKAKTKAPAKVAPKAPPVRRQARYADDAVIKLTPLGLKGNPKRGQTDAWKLYENYAKKGGITVGKYVELAKNTGRPKAGRVAIAWDVARKYITVTDK